MLIATEPRKARVHGRFLKPSTNRSEVVKPTSNRPPTISHSHGMTFLSLDGTPTRANLRRNGSTKDHRQHRRAVALPRVPRGVRRRSAARRQPAAQFGIEPDDRVRCRSDTPATALRAADPLARFRAG